MSDTPRTDAVLEASRQLPHGSVVEIPEGHPPSDPWELSRTLETENAQLKAEIERLEGEVENKAKVLTDVKSFLRYYLSGGIVTIEDVKLLYPDVLRESSVEGAQTDD